MKPIFRWTIGNMSENGYDCLDYSISSIFKLYGDAFDYYIMHKNNNLNIHKIRQIVGHKPVSLIFQTREYLPIDCEGNRFWNLCPARLNINCHEIFSENDIVFTNKISQIDEFLSRTNSVVLVDEKCHGGFFGLPPGYDIGSDVFSMWKQNGSPTVLEDHDEQMLITSVLRNQDHILISKDQFLLVHSKGVFNFGKYDPVNFFDSNIDAYHFAGVNKKDVWHDHWNSFKKQLKIRLL